MKRLVLLLLVGLGWAAYSSLASKRSPMLASGDAFPFPTRDDHGAVALASPEQTARWCSELDCTESELRDAIEAVGRSVPAIRHYLARAH